MGNYNSRVSGEGIVTDYRRPNAVDESLITEEQPLATTDESLDTTDQPLPAVEQNPDTTDESPKTIDEHLTTVDESLTQNDDNSDAIEESLYTIDMRFTREGLETNSVTRRNLGTVLCGLPKEIQTTIWTLITATCQPRVNVNMINQNEVGLIWGIYSDDDTSGRHSPHPLVPVCKQISAEFKEMMYRNAVVRMGYMHTGYFTGAISTPIQRLTMEIKYAQLLRFTTPLIGDGPNRPPRQLVCQIAPELEYLEIEWIRGDEDPIKGGWYTGGNLRMLARLLWYKKSFEVTIKIEIHSYKLIVYLTSGTMYIRFEYRTDAPQNKEFEDMMKNIVRKTSLADYQDGLKGFLCCDEHAEIVILIRSRYPYSRDTQGGGC